MPLNKRTMNKTALLAMISVIPFSAFAEDGGAIPDSEVTITRIGIAGCHRQDRPAPALSRYVEARPDLMLWVGDNVYADTTDDIDYLVACHEALANKPAFQQLRAQSLTMAGWDDHDYGLNNYGKNYRLKTESLAFFRRFWNAEEFIPEDQDGTYHARIFGSGERALQVIVLDGRYNRDDPGRDGDTLGERQWKWLENQLRQPARLRLIVSGYQVLLDAGTKFESWSYFPKAQKRLFDLIKATGAEGVVFITGDQHYGEVLRIRDALGYDAVELMFSGINQEEPHIYASHRVSPVSHAKDAHALLDIHWDDDPFRADNADRPHLLLNIYDSWKNTPELTYRVNLDELRLPLQLNEKTEFLDHHHVSIAPAHHGLEIRFTTDGRVPGKSSPVYNGPIRVSETTTIRAALFDPNGNRCSSVRERTYTQVSPIPAVELKQPAEGLQFTYREGEFLKLAEAERAPVLARGVATSLNPAGPARREDHYAIDFRGYLMLEETDLYTFDLTSDDGARLYLHGNPLIDNDGSHSATTVTREAALEAGAHPIRINYFQDYMARALTLRVTNSKGELVPCTFVHQPAEPPTP